MKTIEKSENEKYKEWLSENDKFLERFLKEHIDKAIIAYFTNMTNEKFTVIFGPYLYTLVRDLAYKSTEYYNSVNKKSPFNDGYTWVIK